MFNTDDFNTTLWIIRMNTRAASLLKITLGTSLLLSLPIMGVAANTMPQKWKLDVPKTSADFEVKYLGKATTDGKFRKVNGSINYDVKKPESTTINFTVHTDSIDTERKLRDSFFAPKGAAQYAAVSNDDICFKKDQDDYTETSKCHGRFYRFRSNQTVNGKSDFI